MDSTKREMIYQSQDSGNNPQAIIEREAAIASMGLPRSIDLPPSYDMALAGPSSYNPPSNPTTCNSDDSIHIATPILPPVPTISQQPKRSRRSSRPKPAKPAKLGPIPSAVTCPECGEYRTTRMHYTANIRTHLFALLLCLVGFCCCACFVPYCMNSCKTGNHYCSKCSKFLGSHTSTWRT